MEDLLRAELQECERVQVSKDDKKNISILMVH